MSTTIEFGAFVESATGTRLAEAQRVARDLGVSVNADGTRFAGTGSAGDPVKVTVVVPAGTTLTPALIRQGRNAFDDLLDGNERLTDYAVVKQDGVVTQVVSLLTAESKTVNVPSAAAAAAPAAPARPRRWNPFAGR